MKLIELHWNGNPYSLNVDYIVAVCKMGGDSETESEIFTVGDKRGDSWNAEESYEEVMQMIQEASAK